MTPPMSQKSVVISDKVPEPPRSVIIRCFFARTSYVALIQAVKASGELPQCLKCAAILLSPPRNSYCSLTPRLGISDRLRYRRKCTAHEDTTMANDSCGPTPPPNDPAKPPTPLVHCVKLSTHLPPTDPPPS